MVLVDAISHDGYLRKIYSKLKALTEFVYYINKNTHFMFMNALRRSTQTKKPKADL